MYMYYMNVSTKNYLNILVLPRSKFIWCFVFIVLIRTFLA